MSAVGLVVLAAGASTRMGTPKQLLPYRGRSLLRHTVEVAIASVCRPIVVVLGANANRIQPELDQIAVQTVRNLQWADGMGTSLRSGISALIAADPNLQAAVVALCDQPFISTQLINQIVEAYNASAQPIVACVYAETLGVPALFDRALFAELLSLDGAIGAKQILQHHRHEVGQIVFTAGSIDIDTPTDYEQLTYN